jgi:hypothetical protein
MIEHSDDIVIGSRAGGATLPHKPAPAGRHILLPGAITGPQARPVPGTPGSRGSRHGACAVNHPGAAVPA